MSSWSTSGPTPASTGSASFPTSAPGPRNTGSTGWSCSAFTAPEFDVEHDLDNVGRAIKNLRVDYPVVIDNDYAVWDAFGNRYWPALYFVDIQGRVRHHRFGEGDYEQSEAIMQRLLTEAGIGGIGHDLVPVDAGGVEAAADWDSLWSPENYLGYERTENFASPPTVRSWTPRTAMPSPRGWPSTSGPWPATGR